MIENELNNNLPFDKKSFPFIIKPFYNGNLTNFHIHSIASIQLHIWIIRSFLLYCNTAIKQNMKMVCTIWMRAVRYNEGSWSWRCINIKKWKMLVHRTYLYNLQPFSFSIFVVVNFACIEGGLDRHKLCTDEEWNDSSSTASQAHMSLTGQTTLTRYRSNFLLVHFNSTPMLVLCNPTRPTNPPAKGQRNE